MLSLVPPGSLWQVQYRHANEGDLFVDVAAFDNEGRPWVAGEYGLQPAAGAQLYVGDGYRFIGLSDSGGVVPSPREEMAGLAAELEARRIIEGSLAELSTSIPDPAA